MSSRKSWTMRTKPRSAIRTVQWLPAFIKVEGKNWERKEETNDYGTPIHLVRGEYLRYAHPYEDYAQTKDPESNARQEKSIYEYFGFGYVNQSGLVVITPAGHEIVSSGHPEEIMLRQLLKWQFPSAACDHGSLSFRHMRVHPFKILLEVLREFDYVTRYEVSLTFFTCLQDDKIPRVPARAATKVQQLRDKFTFEFYDDYIDQTAYFTHYGDPYSVHLPWETDESLRELVSHKVRVLYARLNDLKTSDVHLKLDLKAEEAEQRLKGCTTLAELKSLDELLFKQLVSLNEHYFVSHYSKTAKVRQEILDKFDEILSGDADQAALWLEVNTWKSLVALNGKHHVKRNFKVEEDLSPRSFAPGIGNTPDMELYNKDFVIIPEVSLQSGVSQWITEGSSVIDHVYKFIEVKEGNRTNNDIFLVVNDHRPIIGFFLCNCLNERTGWQFFVLNRESWRGQPIPIVPLELGLYKKLLECYYSKDIPAIKFENLLYKIHIYAHQVNHFQEWLKGISILIEEHLQHIRDSL